MSGFYSLSDADQAARLTGLAEAALARWDGRFDRPELVKYRENAVFSVRRDDGARCALRVHRHGYHSDAALRSELHWMGLLRDAGIGAPPVIPAADGSAFVHVEAAGVPEARQVDMLGWLPGAPIGSSETGLALAGADGIRLFHDVGALAAAVHNRSEGLALPPDFTRHSWCEQGLIGDDPLWGRFWELDSLTGAQRALLLAARDKAKPALADFGRAASKYGLIHADFVPENVLHDNGALRLIDFDDAGFGWHMFELATALYFLLDEPDYARLRDALFEGYRTRRVLSVDDEAALPLFLFLRGTTYLGWVQTRSETQTAREVGPMLVERTCALARAYLDG